MNLQTQGDGDGLSPPPIDYVEYTATDLKITRRITFPEWLVLGEALRMMETGIQWWIGDWLLYGEGAFQDRYSQAVDETDYELKTLQNQAYVAGSVPASRRRENLSWSHHAEVASLSPAQQNTLLDWAAGPVLRGERPHTVKALRQERDRQTGRNIAYLIGLDQSLTKTGWAAFNGPDFVESGMVYANSWQSMFLAIVDTITRVSGVWPVGLALEPVYQGPNPKITIRLSKLYGALAGWCLKNEVPLYEFATVREIDSKLNLYYPTGGRKAAVEAAVSLLIGLSHPKPPTNEHERDAIAVGWAATGERKKKQWAGEDLNDG